MVENAELVEMLKECRKKGVVTPEILQTVMGISRRFLTYDKCASCEKNEVVQNVLIRFAESYGRIDLSRNVFAYITKMVRNELRMHQRKSRIRSKHIAYEADYSDTSIECIAASQELKTREFRAVGGGWRI